MLTCADGGRGGARESGTPQHIAEQLSGPLLVQAGALQLLFGMHGIFSYWAVSLVGVAIGHRFHHDGGITPPLLRWCLVGSLSAIAVGMGLMVQLRRRIIDGADVDVVTGVSQLDEMALNLAGPKAHSPDAIRHGWPAADSLMRSAPHTRLITGGTDMIILLCAFYFVEVVPSRRAVWEVASIPMRRFGEVSFSIYAWHDVILKLVHMPFAHFASAHNMTTRGGGVTLCTNCTEAELEASREEEHRHRQDAGEALLLLLFLATVLYALRIALWVWSLVGYACSFEWAVGKLLGAAGHHSTTKPAQASRPITTRHDVGSGTPALATATARTTATWEEWGTFWGLCLSWTWMWPIAWGVVCTQTIAPAVLDEFYEAGATNLLTTAAKPPRYKLSVLVVCAFYLLPLAASSVAVMCGGWRGRKGTRGGDVPLTSKKVD